MPSVPAYCTFAKCTNALIADDTNRKTSNRSFPNRFNIRKIA